MQPVKRQSLPRGRLRSALSQAKRWVSRRRQFPWPLGNELAAVGQVLRSSQWNMGYGAGLVHEKLEREFAEYTGNAEAVAVNTGGMAIQIALRALGLRPGQEVLHPVDTCIANAFSVMNAGGSPILIDCDTTAVTLSIDSLKQWVGPSTRFIIPVHLWGYPQNLQPIRQLADSHELIVIEDCCLALGATVNSKSVGRESAASVFSFGCVKPIQAGEGGMIVTQDAALAREMRSIRSWGERFREFGEDDVTTLSWNGRMSEIVAAVALEQLRGYPLLLEETRQNNFAFLEYLKRYSWLRPFESCGQPCFNQLLLHFDCEQAEFSISQFRQALLAQGVGATSANFEPIPRYSFFRKGNWKAWIAPNAHTRLEKNYMADFPNANRCFDSSGLGICRNNFLGRDAVKILIRSWERALGELQTAVSTKRSA